MSSAFQTHGRIFFFQLYDDSFEVSEKKKLVEVSINSVSTGLELSLIRIRPHF